MLPIHDLLADAAGACSRGHPKYLNSPETPLFHKGRQLFNFTDAGDPERAQAILFEGHGCYRRLAGRIQTGVGLGTSLSDDQARMIGLTRNMDDLL